MTRVLIPTLLSSMAFATWAHGQTTELDPEAAAGKLIYEGVTHRLGCERCHAADGTAKADGKTFAAERNIQGKTAEEIRISIMATPMMWNVKLTDEELSQVAAYLMYLKDVKN